jgi:hypothetical protein
MRSTVIAAIILLGPVVCVSSYAQKAGTGSNGNSGAAHDVSPASAGQAMGHPAASGTAKSAEQGSLMQKRESAMAPDGASGSSASGKMKQ